MKKKMSKTVIIGLSGGVDSCAAAYHLKKEGYDVIGVTFNFFNEEKMLSTAAKAASELGITHHIIDAQSQFYENVIKAFVDGYKKGETPNPCMLCNQSMKFRLLLEIAQNYGGAKIATGHYGEIQKVGEHYRLLASENLEKDQSYFLYHLDQSILSRLILPIDNFKTKAVVRKSIHGILPDVAEGSESQGICFIPKGNHPLFLKNAIFGSGPVPSGNLVDCQGKIIGKHRGTHGFTLGQTRGLGIENPKRLVVVDINPKTNAVTLGREEALLKNKIKIEGLHLNLGNNPCQKDITFKICRWGYEYPGTFECLPNQEAIVYSDVSVRAPAPGQALVFYRNRQVLGGGIIKNFDKSDV